MAVVAGHSVLRLETGSYLPGAIRLYVSSGYREIPVYGEYVGNPYSVCFEKRLSVPTGTAPAGEGRAASDRRR